jgi:hypothetical protein
MSINELPVRLTTLLWGTEVALQIWSPPHPRHIYKPTLLEAVTAWHLWSHWSH